MANRPKQHTSLLGTIGVVAVATIIALTDNSIKTEVQKQAKRLLKVSKKGLDIAEGIVSTAEAVKEQQ